MGYRFGARCRIAEGFVLPIGTGLGCGERVCWGQCAPGAAGEEHGCIHRAPGASGSRCEQPGTPCATQIHRSLSNVRLQDGSALLHSCSYICPSTTISLLSLSNAPTGTAPLHSHSASILAHSLTPTHVSSLGFPDRGCLVEQIWGPSVRACQGTNRCQRPGCRTFFSTSALDAHWPALAR